MKKYFGIWFLLFGVLPMLLLAYTNEPCPFLLEDPLEESLGSGVNFQSLKERKIVFQLWTRDKITPELKGSLNTEGHLIGKYIFKGFLFNLNLGAQLKNGSIETDININQLDFMLERWVNKYQIPRVWRFKEAKLDQVNFVEEKGFDARWKVVSRFNYFPVARMAVPDFDGAIEDVTGVLGRYQDFINFIESDGRSLIILQNNKSGLPIFLDYEGDPRYPVFTARHPMHRIVWDEKRDLLQFEYLDVLGDVQKIPEIKGALKKKEVKAFVGEDFSHIRVKGKGSQREGFEILFFKPEEKKGLLVKLKRRKVIQMEEMK